MTPNEISKFLASLQAQMDNIAATLLLEVTKANPGMPVQDRVAETERLFKTLYESAGGVK